MKNIDTWRRISWLPKRLPDSQEDLCVTELFTAKCKTDLFSISPLWTRLYFSFWGTGLFLGSLHNNFQLPDLKRDVLQKINVICSHDIPIEEQQENVWGEPVAMQIKVGKWMWIGHSLRNDSFALEEWVFSWSPLGKRRRGRPRRNWRRMIEKKSEVLGKTGREVKVIDGNSALDCFMGAVCTGVE